MKSNDMENYMEKSESHFSIQMTTMQKKNMKAHINASNSKLASEILHSLRREIETVRREFSASMTEMGLEPSETTHD